MLASLIHASLKHRLPVLLLAAILLGLGAHALVSRPLDIFPNLNQPMVTVMA